MNSPLSCPEGELMRRLPSVSRKKAGPPRFSCTPPLKQSQSTEMRVGSSVLFTLQSVWKKEIMIYSWNYFFLVAKKKQIIILSSMQNLQHVAMESSRSFGIDATLQRMSSSEEEVTSKQLVGNFGRPGFIRPYWLAHFNNVAFTTPRHRIKDGREGGLNTHTLQCRFKDWAHCTGHWSIIKFLCVIVWSDNILCAHHLIKNSTDLTFMYITMEKIRAP